MVFCVYLLFWACWDGSIWMADKEQTGCTWCYLYMLYTYYYYYFCFSASFFINNKTQNEANALGSNWRRLHWLWLAASGGPGEAKQPNTISDEPPTSSFFFSSFNLPQKTLPRQHTRRASLSVYLFCLSFFNDSFCLLSCNPQFSSLCSAGSVCQLSGRWKVSLCSDLGAYANLKHENWF